MFEFRQFFTRKHISVPFRNYKILVWSRWYWFVQFPLVSFPYNLYYNKFQKLNWKNVPRNKPVILAETHRNAFMDSLACVNTGSSQVAQLARGDAFQNRVLRNIFHFFHMLPIWRERDEPGGDIKARNDVTFNTCFDLLANNGMVGIYPEGDCINVNMVRPLKKGICRLAFGAEERYDFNLDIQIVPVGVTYTAAEKFKKWAVISFGEPIALQAYTETYKTNPALAINQLKNAIEKGMQKVSLHISGTSHFETKEQLATMYARHMILERNEKYEPVSKLIEEKKVISSLEQMEATEPEEMNRLKEQLTEINKGMRNFNFRENTFDKARQHPLSIFLMLLYFIVMLPVFLYGTLVNYIPYIIPQRIVQKKIKQKIFYSSIKYVIGFPIFMLFYLLLAVVVWAVLGSVLSAVIFFISFPIAGHIAFYYWYDLKKMRSLLKLKRLRRQRNPELQQLESERTGLFQKLEQIMHQYPPSEA